MYDYTTYPEDCLPKALEIITELQLLDYNYNFIKSICTKCNRIRKDNIWKDIIMSASLFF